MPITTTTHPIGDLIDLRTTFAAHIHDALVEFRQIQNGYPGRYASQEDWFADLDDVADAFADLYLLDDAPDTEDQGVVDAAFTKLARIYLDLWD